MVSFTHAQSLQVKGTITDSATQKPISFANIFNNRSKKTAISAADGSFTIMANKGDLLQINFVGYAEKYVKVEDETSLSIYLSISSTQLNDVVVTALGIKKK